MTTKSAVLLAWGIQSWELCGNSEDVTRTECGAQGSTRHCLGEDGGRLGVPL